MGSKMTHEEETEQFLGEDGVAPPEQLCHRCNNYPCECTMLDVVEFEG